MAAVSANKLEIIQVADALAREKSIERELVIEAMEEALVRAAKMRYGQNCLIKAHIDPKSGESRLWRELEVVEIVEEPAQQVSVADSRRYKADAALGDTVEESLPDIVFGRASALAAKQVITQKVREAERERQYGEFVHRIGEVITGIVQRSEYGHLIIDLGRAEGLLRRDQQIPGEVIRQGDRVRSYIMDVRKDTQGQQIILSRTHPDFMRELFAVEVPEIYEKIIEIKSVARDAGSRAKISVTSHESSIDPVGACVGLRGSRVQAVVNELAGEKIDIVLWSEDLATFVVNALSPAEVEKVVLDEVEKRIEVVVAEDQLSLAIGRRGQNVRLAAELTGYEIDILTEEQESSKRQEEYRQRTALFTEALNVDEIMGGLLAMEGFVDIEDVAYVDPEELLDIEGFDEETVAELQSRAGEFLKQRDTVLHEERKSLKADAEMVGFAGLTLPMVVALARNGVTSVEALSTCVPEDLVGWDEYKKGIKKRYEGFLESFSMGGEEAVALIEAARTACGEQEETDAQQTA